jgi:RNA polymerase sigma-70 factor, ECF subfamily
METSAVDHRVFEELLSPLLDPAFGLAFSMTRNSADAEDVVQEAAMRAFRAFDTFEQGTNFKAWFYRILTNCCYARHRTSKRRPEIVDLDDANELYLYRQTRTTGLHERSNDPASILMDRLSAERVAEAISMLPEEYQSVAMLYFLEDYSYQEIADALDIPVGTVRSRLHRGRRMLQKALWVIAKEEGIVSELRGPVNA